MKKGLLVILLVFCLAFVSSMASGKTLTYAHTNAAQGVAGLQAQKFADLVSEKTNGEIKILVYPSSQLGKLDEMIQGVSLGAIDMGHNDFAALATLLKDLSVFNLPYLYNSPQAALRATGPESPVIQKFNVKLIQKANVRLLYSFYYGTRQLSCNSPVYYPQDLKDKKIRAIPVKVWLETVKGMGAIPTPVDFSELPTALATNIVDGQENPLDTIWSNKFYEFQDYVMLTSHMIATLPVYINENSWQSLSAEQQQAVMEAGMEAQQWAYHYVINREKELISQLKETGTEIIGPDNGLKLEQFKQRVNQHILKAFPEWTAYIEEIKVKQ